MPANTADDDLVTVLQAADMLDMHRSSVLKLLERGDLATAMKLPGETGAILLRRTDVEQLARARARQLAAKLARLQS